MPTTETHSEIEWSSSVKNKIIICF